MGAAPDRVGAGRAGVGDQPERRRVEIAGLIEPGEQPLQVRRDAEHGRRAHLVHRGDEGLRLEAREDGDRSAGEQRARREPQGSGVMDRGDDEVDVVRDEAPEVALLAHQALGIVG